jgi:beta-lactamase class A
MADIAPQVGFVAAEVSNGTCQPLARVEPDLPLAIASSFKLYVLGEMAHQVTSGEASWSDWITLDADLISMPNGEMRYLEPGQAFPAAFVAEQMISKSDNTATDHLIGYLGREEVEESFARMGQADPTLNEPLMLTREWFAIRMRFSAQETRQYLDASDDAQRSILANDASPTASTLLETEPWFAFHGDESVEWYASAMDLCNAMAWLQEAGTDPVNQEVLDALSIAPGIPFDPAIWSFVGYKGGYETGVASNVWLLQRSDGRWFVLASVINDPDAEIDGGRLFSLMLPAADLLAKTE